LLQQENFKLLHVCNIFCEEVYVVAFFKVMWQQITGKVANSIICLWAVNLSATVKELLK